MANFKRGKCRRHGRITFTSEKTTLKSLGVQLPIESWSKDVPRQYWTRYGRNPGKWNRSFHSRPHRARTRQTARQVLQGADHEAVNWPTVNRPNKYFW